MKTYLVNSNWLIWAAGMLIASGVHDKTPSTAIAGLFLFIAVLRK